MLLSLSLNTSLDGENYTIGKGTTGLGAQCNQILARDRQQHIREYNNKKEREKRQAQIDANRAANAKQKRRHSDADDSKLSQLELIKQQRRELIIKERIAMQEEVRADKERVEKQKREEVERERRETRERKEKQRVERIQYEETRRKGLQEEVKRERELLAAEEKRLQKEVQQRHEWQKALRVAYKERAVAEKLQYEEAVKADIEAQKKKLEKLAKERKVMSAAILKDKQDEIKVDKAAKIRRDAKKKEQDEREIEAFHEACVQEKERITKEIKAREQVRLDAMRQHITTLREERKQGQIRIQQHYENVFEAKKNNAEAMRQAAAARAQTREFATGYSPSAALPGQRPAAKTPQPGKVSGGRTSVLESRRAMSSMA
eukprot:TRINITY_DN53011_c0_g1_i1.p1 TRINITY_DN53011_c0_g1~~TRINITY_DN53011_c0_g1_i1.p1  ORF type:complete len:376 (-),score=72.51 TRINITY_DN53011_c0_g1_i1:102-1229(-)